MSIWRDGILGVLAGDGMWSAAGSMTLAEMDSLREMGTADSKDMMERFAAWLLRGRYTPLGEETGVGGGTLRSIVRFLVDRNADACGGDSERDNGDGSLARIMPFCLYCHCRKMQTEDAVNLIHGVSALTHRHLRSEMACGLYYFMAEAVLEEEGELTDRLQDGLDRGFEYYMRELESTVELAGFARLRNLYAFRDVPDVDIESSGYVIDTLESAVWCLITTTSLEQALQKAEGKGPSTGTGAAAGGLAGLFYGAGDLPEERMASFPKREWVLKLCDDLEKGEGLWH